MTGDGRESPKSLIGNPNVLAIDVRLHSLGNFLVYAIIGLVDLNAT